MTWFYQLLSSYVQTTNIPPKILKNDSQHLFYIVFKGTMPRLYSGYTVQSLWGVTLELNTHKIRSLGLWISPCRSMPWYFFLIFCFSPLAICFHPHLAFDSSRHCCRVHRKWFNTWPFALLPSTAPLISSCLFLPSAHREPRVCWSRPLSPRCSPPPALRGNLRQLIPAQTTAQSWTLTPHRSLPQTVGPVVPLALKVMPLSRDTARVGQRKANEKLCTYRTQLSRTPFLLPLWMLARAPKAGATSRPFLPLCTDPSAKTQCSSLHAVTVRHKWYQFKTFFLPGLWKSWFTYCMCVWGWEF